MFEYVKLNLERTTQGLLTNKSEFIYADNESPVPANKTYSVYYLNDKRKLYFTNLLTSNYIFAHGRYFFVYPNEYRKFTNRFQDSFQHGGISMEEMIIPVGTLIGKGS